MPNYFTMVAKDDADQPTEIRTSFGERFGNARTRMLLAENMDELVSERCVIEERV